MARAPLSLSDVQEFIAKDESAAKQRVVFQKAYEALLKQESLWLGVPLSMKPHQVRFHQFKELSDHPAESSLASDFYHEWRQRKDTEPSRSDREDEVAFFLEDQGIVDAWDLAPGLVDAGFDRAAVERIDPLEPGARRTRARRMARSSLAPP